jgi:hypothetical protein
MVSVMHSRRAPHADSSGPENVDRRREFLDIVERLGQGVVTVRRAEPEVRNQSSDQPSGEPSESTPHKPHRP